MSFKSSPNFDLLQRFGNEEVYRAKLAGELPLALKAMMASLNVGSSQHELDHEQHLRLQAERMNRALAEFQAMKMRQTELGASHAYMRPTLFAIRPGEDHEIGLPEGEMGLSPALQRAPRRLYGDQVPLGFDEGMTRMASAMGQDLAKLAGMGSLVKPKLPKIMSVAAAKPVVTPKIPTQKTPQLPQVSTKTPAPSGTPKVQQAPAGAIAPQPTGVQSPSGGTTTGNQASPQLPSPPQAQAAAPGAAAPSNPATPPSGTPETPGLMDKAKAMWSQANINPKTMLGLAGGLAGIYGAYQGAKKLKDVMSQEAAPAQYGSGATPAYGINEYGQPQRGTPFGG